MSAVFEAEFSAAIDAAEKAARYVRERAGNAGDVTEKGRHDLVTEVDLEAQRIIIEHLREACPEIDVVAEEGDNHSLLHEPPQRPRWIIDPVDGTTNFTHGVPPYCISIALQYTGGELVVGVIHEVGMNEVFAAARGRGATLNGRPIEVSRTGRLEDCLVTTGFPFREFWFVDEYLAVLKEFMYETRGVRRPGSAAADMAYLACGRFDVFFEAGLAPWDVAAGIVLIEEAGGTVTGLARGHDPLLEGQILATNGRLHEEALRITRSLGTRHARELRERSL